MEMRRITPVVVFLVLAVMILGPTGCKNPYCPSTEEPYVVIDSPPTANVLPQVIKFTWHSGLETDPKAVRYFASLAVDTLGNYNPMFDIVKDLSENPWRYEEKWSEWILYRASDESGTEAIIGIDEELEINKSYYFVVQAMDRCAQVTETFTRNVNFRQFIVTAIPGPVLDVKEPYLGFFRFIGPNSSPIDVDMPGGVPLNFSWTADASMYGGEIACYRYGWDIADLNDPSQWYTECIPGLISAPERTLYSGVHSFFVEARDNLGYTALAEIQINIVPFMMERNLLWVDDFYSTDFTQISYSLPTETEHDTFWLDICSRAEGFEPAVDVFDTRNTGFQPPDIVEIGRYKNIIWTFSDGYDTAAWDNVVRFTPESWVTIGTPHEVNYLPLFLAKGGHLWTLGRSDRGGGLAAVLAPYVQEFPINLACEITGTRQDCDGDQSGIYSMPYKDYCVTVLDKVVGVFRTDPEMPPRSVDFDAMRFAYKDETSMYNTPYPGLPGELQLWNEVTAPGRFFDPEVRGFTYVEIYDPMYWMDVTAVQNQDCFAPMYRMKTRNTLSPVNNTTVALWLTKYEEVVPQVESGVAAPARSVHFGFPLWFFDRAAVDQIVDVIFDEWQISSSP
jgi:hypothetical protein